MSKVFQICISKKFNHEMIKLNHIKAIAGKGLFKDRYFKDNNNKKNQITLIESENIDYYNAFLNNNIPYIDFRRNIITKGIQLNKLINKIILIGNVKIFIHELCEPCLDLQIKLNQKNFVKNLLHKGGLRAEIIQSGTISINDKIYIFE